MTKTFTRRQAGFIAASFMAGIGPAAGKSAGVIRLSYQRSSSLLQLLRQNGRLEKDLGAMGFELQWSLLSTDLMRTGSVDLHGDIAETVPLVVHPANPTLTLYAAEGPSPHAVALIVPENSPIRTTADLKGHTVATSRGSSSHDLMMRALRHGGLSMRDIHPAYLQAPDAAAAFDSGSIDAWAIYDPFLAVAQARSAVRVVADGADFGMRYDRYYMVNADFAAKHGDVVQRVFTALQETGAWVTQNKEAAAPLLSRLWGDVPVDTVQRVNARRVYDVRAIGAPDIANLHFLADEFLELGLLKEPLDAKSIPVWTPGRVGAG